MLENIPILSGYDKGNGVCRYLSNNLCSIYENRPQVCSIEKMYFSYFKNVFTEQEFIDINIKACIQIQECFREKAYGESA
jgi:Fe-S-cluster containining protein